MKFAYYKVFRLLIKNNKNIYKYIINNKSSNNWLFFNKWYKIIYKKL